jgi:galactose-1-phosphate uridylyltransferase
VITFLHRTLHKIHTYLEAQQDRNTIKALFRINEMQNLLKDCHAGLEQAVAVFGVCMSYVIALWEIDLNVLDYHWHCNIR